MTDPMTQAHLKSVQAYQSLDGSLHLNELDAALCNKVFLQDQEKQCYVDQLNTDTIISYIADYLVEEGL